MRTFETFVGVLAIGAAFAVTPALAFDGSKADDADAAIAGPVAPPLTVPHDAVPRPPADVPSAPPVKAAPTASEAFRSGAHWLKAGDRRKAVVSLEYAAENGHPLAQWK